MYDQLKRLRQYPWFLFIFLLFLLLNAGEWHNPSYAGTVVPTGRIWVVKETKPSGSDVDFPFEVTRNNLSRTFTLRDGERKRVANLTPASGYQITEALPDGWAQESATCDDGSPVNNITVGEGEVVTCTFVNVLLGKIIIKKVTNPLSDVATTFTFASNVADGGALQATSFPLRNGEIKVLSDIIPGNNYAISEIELPGWELSSALCSDGSPINKIDVQPGETVTCTFTNTQNGKLIVRKVTDPAPDRTNTEFLFTTDNTLNPNTFPLKNEESVTFSALKARSGYRLRELATDHWQLTSSTCSNGSPIANIRIDPGATVTCIFRNAGTLVDLHLTKSDGDVIAEPGDTIVYTLHYRNDGTQNATVVAITEQVPAHTLFVGPTGPEGWSCPANAPAGTSCRYNVGNLSGNATGQISFKVKVADAIPTGVTTIQNTAKIGYIDVAEVEQSSTTTPLKTSAGLSLSKGDDGATAEPGGTVLYTLNYSNLGNQVLSHVQITETVPLYTTFAGPAALWDCPLGAAANAICVHEIAQLNVNESGTATFSVKVANSLPANVTVIENRAQIGNGQLTPDTGTEQTELRAAPDLSVGLDDDEATVTPGGMVRYRLTYANVGSQGATNVVITKNIPPYTTFHAAFSSNGWVCTTSRCTYTVGTLASGAGDTINFALALARPLPAETTSIINSAQIADDGMNGTDVALSNNSTQVTTSIEDLGTIVATKRALLTVDANADHEPSPGDTLEYIVTLQNQRGIGVREVQFSDSLASSFYLSSGATTTQGTVTTGDKPGDPQVVVNIGTMAGDSTVVIRFRVGIRTPLPASIQSVSNQGVIASRELPTIRTDDPGTAAANDPTITAINARAQLEMSLADFLFVDSDGDTLVSVGDTLIYRLKLQNRGNGGSPSLQIRVPLAENAVLVEKSVTTSAGIIREGNDPDDQIVRVDIGEVAGGAEVNISFQVYIITKAGFTTIQHQAGAFSQGTSGAANVISDDPDTSGSNDMTISVLDQEIVTVRYLYLPLISK